MCTDENGQQPLLFSRCRYKIAVIIEVVAVAAKVTAAEAVVVILEEVMVV